MPDEPPARFDLLRACFWLLAIIVGVLMVMLLAAAGGCIAGILMGRAEPGTCIKLGLPEMIHEWWSELLTAILALLVARPNAAAGATGAAI